MGYKKREIYIYGAGNRGTELLENIETFYTDKIGVAGFIDSKKTGLKCELPIYKVHMIPKESIIVISLIQFEIALQVALDLRKQGFFKVYWYNVKTYRKERMDFFEEQCVDCNDWSEETLFHVEMHAMDACNLNCVGCTHFSPIFKKEKLDTEKQLSNVEEFRQKIASIVQFHILGGEPFLNDEILCYVKKVRYLYPKSSVIVVTNGLLIPNLPKNILEYFAKENICISISEYEPTHRIIEQIETVLNQYNVMYYIRESREKFNIPLSLKQVEEVYCISNGCITIAKGKIARCPSLMYIEELNNKFHLSFPSEGMIDLASDISGVKLKKKLQEPVPLCQHCVKNEVNWSTCGSKVLVEHFVKL